MFKIKDIKSSNLLHRYKKTITWRKEVQEWFDYHKPEIHAKISMNTKYFDSVLRRDDQVWNLEIVPVDKYGWVNLYFKDPSMETHFTLRFR